jgi:hypothetical protein
MEARTETCAARDKLDKDEIQLVANADNAFAMGQGVSCAATGKRSGRAKGDMKRSKLLRATPEIREEREAHTLVYLCSVLPFPSHLFSSDGSVCLHRGKQMLGFFPITACACVVRVSVSLVGTRASCEYVLKSEVSVGGSLASGSV